MVARRVTHPYYESAARAVFPNLIEVVSSCFEVCAKPLPIGSAKPSWRPLSAPIIIAGIWGIADVFRGGGHATVATVGNAEISAEQFRQTYGPTAAVPTPGRPPIPPEQARALGIDRQILEKMMAEAALDQRTLGLGVGDDEIGRRIMQDPAFRGINGQLDQQRFEQSIRAAGFTEPRFRQSCVTTLCASNLKIR